MIVSAALCPCAPLLAPELGLGPAELLRPLRAAVRAAIRSLAAAGPDRLVVLAPTAGEGWFGPGAAGDLAGYGRAVPVRLPGAAAAGGPALPDELALGARLLADAGWPTPAHGLAVPRDASPAHCRRLAADLAASAAATALLVLGDGSARRAENSPAPRDPRAVPFDEAAARALLTGDRAALAGLDPVLAAELAVRGRAPWQVLAAAWGDDRRVVASDGGYHAAPFGVDYLVATWSAGGAGQA